LSGASFDPAQAQKVSSPLDIQFRRQAVRRLVFDRDSAIPLSMLQPAKIVKLGVEHPAIEISGSTTSYKVDKGLLTVSAGETVESALWVGGFNPYGTYDVSFAPGQGNAGKAGIEFATPDNQNRLSILAGFKNSECQTIHWQIMVDGTEKQNETITLDTPVRGPFILRVQVIGTKLNVLVEQNGVSKAVDVRDFMQLIDLRRKEHIRSFEFRLLTKLNAGESVVIKEATAALTTGVGQADLCAITYKDGSPLLDQGRLWFTTTIRGRHFPQGVFSMDPSVFDVRLEGIIAFDRNDGLLRNELASHIFYDEKDNRWRGLTVGMSAYYDTDKRIGKQLWAVSSKKDPRFGFSVMKADPIVLPNSSEDPHIIYDQEAQRWRVLACAKGGVGFPATLYESDHWDGPYEIIAGPVGVNSTGCLLQKFGSKYYALFGSKDRKFYVYSYPDLKQLGALDVFRPPWDHQINTRCWPNVIPLPDGYPAPYIALTMDRANFSGLGSHMYGALYLYHGYPKHDERDTYEYSTEVDSE
jgi:hypothetical protein